MKKTLAAFVAVVTIAGSLAATPVSAQRGVAACVPAPDRGASIARCPFRLSLHGNFIGLIMCIGTGKLPWRMKNTSLGF